MNSFVSGGKKSVKYGLFFGMLFLLGSCASTNPPTQELAQTEAAINQADQVGAKDYAPLMIREARKKLLQAKELSADGEHEKARRLAQRAEVDAELAEATALSEKAQNAVRQLRESIRLLKEEINQNQQGK